jgi:hypothetical protein
MAARVAVRAMELLLTIVLDFLMFVLCVTVCVRHFEWNGTAFVQQGSKKVGAGPALHTVPPMGNTYSSLAMSSDGRTVMVGSNYDDELMSGATYLWARGVDGYGTDEWVQLGERLAYPTLPPSFAGYSVGLSGDVSQLAVGGQLLSAVHSCRNKGAQWLSSARLLTMTIF